jgi:hypothetical protein
MRTRSILSYVFAAVLTVLPVAAILSACALS